MTILVINYYLMQTGSSFTFMYIHSNYVKIPTVFLFDTKSDVNFEIMITIQKDRKHCDNVEL